MYCENEILANKYRLAFVNNIIKKQLFDSDK